MPEEIFTVTITGDNMEPCTVPFDTRHKANGYKELLEKIISKADLGYRVTLDSGKLNNGEAYLQEIAERAGVDIPDVHNKAANDSVEYTVGYAVEGRYYSTVRLPRGTKIPTANSTEKLKGFIEMIKAASLSGYYDADFGDLQDIDGGIVNVEDSEGNIIWEA